jgi:hypothetical protein
MIVSTDAAASRREYPDGDKLATSVERAGASLLPRRLARGTSPASGRQWRWHHSLSCPRGLPTPCAFRYSPLRLKILKVGLIVEVTNALSLTVRCFY